jgi:AcrR family transcriptional regulator
LTSERPGKRDRLIAGARETIHRQGVEATTLADIAEASGVPLGNVYYYFKSKDELVAAAIDSYAGESRERLSWLEQQHRTSRGRLKTLVGSGRCGEPSGYRECKRGRGRSERPPAARQLRRHPGNLRRSHLVCQQQEPDAAKIGAPPLSDPVEGCERWCADLRLAG